MNIKRFDFGTKCHSSGPIGVGVPDIIEKVDGKYMLVSDHQALDEKYTDLLIQSLDQAKAIKRLNDELAAIGAGGVSMMGDRHTPHWYAVDSLGMATLCVDERDAIESAKEFAETWPNRSPYFVGRVMAVDVGKP